MKMTIMIACVFFAAAPVYAKPRTYDRVGSLIERRYRSDVHLSSTVGGTTYSMHCNVDGASASCTEGTGFYERVRLDDGHEFPMMGPDPGYFVDPLGDLSIENFSKTLAAQTPEDGRAYVVATFNYRLEKGGFCVPYTETKKGKVKQLESCYAIY